MPYINGLQTGLEGRNSVDTRLSTYPSPFFDPSSAYLPPSYKEMFRWTSYLYLTHSEIAPIINKKCSYVITDLIYETDNPVHTEAWRELLERYIKVQQVEFQMLLDYHVYGNAFASIYYPFERTLTCTKCEEKYSPKLIQWQYREGRFYGACKTCNALKPMKAEDRPVKNRSRIKVLRWNPKFIDIDYNPFSDRSTYIYRIPKAIRAKISDHMHGRNKAIVTDTPLEILDAVKEKKNLRIAADNIYHFKNITISTDDPSFGMPPLLPVFKDAWLYQTLRKAQEAIAIDHILPLTLITPAPMGGLSPHMEMDLGDWTSKVQRIIKQWRRDQNGIFTLPFPAQVENIRGDANALSVHNDMEHLKQMIAGGLDVPQEFIYGGLNWCHSLDNGLVTSDNGLLYLGEMVPEVLGEFSMEGKGVYAPGHSAEEGELAVAVNTGNKEALKLTNALGQIAYPSKDHRYWRLNPDTLRGEWVRAEELSVGDNIGVRVGSDVWGSGEPLPSVEVRKTETVVAQPNLDDNLALILGLLVSEGAVTGKRDRACFSMDNLEVVEKFRDAVQQSFGYEPTISVQTPKHGTRFGRNPKYVCDINRKAAGRFIQELMGTGYAKDKSVPRCIRTAPRHVVSMFLRALFEGDGCISKDCVSYASTSLRLLREVQAILLNFGIVTRLYNYPRSSNVASLQIFGDDIRLFQETIGFLSHTKCTKLQNAVSTREAKLFRNPDRERLPYVSDVLRNFVDKHRIGKTWTVSNTCPELKQDTYTVRELAAVLQLDVSSIRLWIRSGKLIAEMSPNGYVITADNFRTYVTSHGLRRRVKTQVPQYCATKKDLDFVDLAWVHTYDAELAANLEELKDPQVIWTTICEIQEAGYMPMGDLTVRDTHSYLIDGTIVHNSGSSVSLRVLENLFLSQQSFLNLFLQEFLVPKLRAYCSLPVVTIKHADFKMADDATQKQIALGLRQTNTISDQTTIEELGFDYEKELKRRAKEEKERLDLMERQQLRAAEIQGQSMVVQARYQSMAQAEAVRYQEIEQARSVALGHVAAVVDPTGGVAAQNAPSGQAAAQTGQTISTVDPSVLSTAADHFLKTYDPQQQQVAMAAMQKSNPGLLQAIKQRQQMISQQVSDAKPLPEQKPPRRKNSPI